MSGPICQGHTVRISESILALKYDFNRHSQRQKDLTHCHSRLGIKAYADEELWAKKSDSR